MTPLLARPSMRLFLLIGFGVPWIGWSIIAITGMEPSPLRTALFYTGDFMTVAGLVATYRAGGGPALRLLLRRCLVGGRIGWWLFALFLPLAWSLLARTAWGWMHGGVGRFEVAGLVGFLAPGALMAFTTGPLGEEAGWRGYLLPRLLGRYSPVVASLILGVAWGVWHVPLYLHSVFSEVGSGATFMVNVIAFTLLMTVLFHRTRGSLLMAVLFHWSVNVAPGVASRMLPSVQVDAAHLRPAEVITLLLVTAVVFAATGRAKLGLTGSFEQLAGEAVEHDRTAA